MPLEVKRVYILETYASTIKISAVSQKKFKDYKLEHPLAYFNRVFSRTKQNYWACKLKVYAIVRAAKIFRVFLLGRKFFIEQITWR